MKQNIDKIIDEFEKDHYCENHGDILIESKLELSGLKFLIKKEFEELKKETAKQIFDDLDEIFYPNTMSYDDEKYQELKKKWSNP